MGRGRPEYSCSCKSKEHDFAFDEDVAMSLTVKKSPATATRDRAKAVDMQVQIVAAYASPPVFGRNTVKARRTGASVGRGALDIECSGHIIGCFHFSTRRRDASTK